MLGFPNWITYVLFATTVQYVIIPIVDWLMYILTNVLMNIYMHTRYGISVTRL